MPKRIKLEEINVNSFVTGPANVMGGGGSLPTGRWCPAICSEETFCPSDCCPTNGC